MNKRRDKNVPVDKKRKKKKKNCVIRKAQPTFKKYDFVAKREFQPRKNRRCRYRKNIEKECSPFVSYNTLVLSFGASVSFFILYMLFSRYVKF